MKVVAKSNGSVYRQKILSLTKYQKCDFEGPSLHIQFQLEKRLEFIEFL